MIYWKCLILLVHQVWRKICLFANNYCIFLPLRPKVILATRIWEVHGFFASNVVVMLMVSFAAGGDSMYTSVPESESCLEQRRPV